MADDNALRSRRKRLHAAGDHSLCRRCRASRPLVALPDVQPVPEASVPPDVTAALERLAQRLEAAHTADPGDANVARELRATLLALRGPEESADDAQARFWADFGSS